MRRNLTRVPEAGEVRCHLRFVLIGPDSGKVCQVAARASIWMQEPSPSLDDGEESTSGGRDELPRRRGSGSSRCSTTSIRSTGSQQSQGIFCVVNTDSAQIARVTLSAIEDFCDSLLPLRSADDIRNTCYCLLVDPRLNVEEDVLPSLQMRFMEIGFGHRRVQSIGELSQRAVPTVRVILLRHQDGAAGEACSHRPFEAWRAPAHGRGSWQEDGLASFAKRLEAATQGNGLKAVQRAVDFGSSAALYACLSDVAVEMHEACHEHPPKAGFGSRKSSDVSRSSSSSACITM